MTVATTQFFSTSASVNNSADVANVRPSVSKSEAFPSMVPGIDTQFADALKDSSSPYSTPRSTDAGDSVAPESPSCRSGCDCSASDTVSTDSGSSSETDSSVSSRRSSQRNLFGAVVTVCAAVSSVSPGTGSATKKLTASPTSWAAQQRLRRQQQGGEADVTRSVRCLLNKLTPERFGTISEQLVALIQNNSAAVAILVREVFQKATTQHSFISMYVDLCVKLESDSRLNPATGKAADTFRRILLGQCQSSFEDMLEVDYYKSDEGLNQEELEELRMVRKQKALGNMKLIGQLLTRGILSSKLLLTCCQDLLSEAANVPDALEFLAALLTVAGPTFDQVQGWVMKPVFEAVFTEVRKMVESPAVAARLRFLLRDLLDLRAAGWKDTKKATAGKAVPMRLDEVRCEADAANKQSSQQQYFSASPISRAQEWQQAQVQKAATRPTRRGGKKARAEREANSGSNSPVESEKKRQVLEAFPSPANSASPFALDAPPVAPVAAAAAEVPALPLPLQKRTGAFDKVAFSREVVATLKELATSHNVAAAVRRIRAQDVPRENQAAEFQDMLARAAEESRGPVRRYAFAFIAGLANGEQSAFDKTACLQGIKSFFLEDYESLCEEVPKLSAIVTSELVPTLRSVFNNAQLETAAVPRSCLR